MSSLLRTDRRRSITKLIRLSQANSIETIYDLGQALSIAKIRRKGEDEVKKRPTVSKIAETTPTPTPSTSSSSLEIQKKLVHLRSAISGAKAVTPSALTDAESTYAGASAEKEEDLLPKLCLSIIEISDVRESSSISSSMNSFEFKPHIWRSIEDKGDVGKFAKPIDSNTTVVSFEVVDAADDDGHDDLSDILKNEYEEEITLSNNDLEFEMDDSSDFSVPSFDSTQKIELQDDSDIVFMDDFLKCNVEDDSAMSSTEKLLIDRVVADTVELFLIKLLNIVVAQCENPGYKLRKALDKRKLVDELIKLEKELKLLKANNEYLNRCVVKTHIKNRIFYTTTAGKSDEQYKDRYKTALDTLDEALQKRDVAKENFRANLEVLNMEKSAVSKVVEKSVRHFEECVRDLFAGNEGSQYMNQFVENELRSMAAVRNEISDVRTQLIIKKHEVEVVKNKLEKMKAISGNLTVHEYLNAQAELQSLSQKNEEFRVELEQLGYKANRVVHWLAHIRYKNHMLKGTLRNARDLFQKKRNEEMSVHRAVYSATVEHDNLNKEIKQIKCDGGLAHFPALLKDFKKVKNLIKEKEKTIEDLIAQHNFLIWRIRQLMIKHDVDDPEMSKFPSLKNTRISKLQKFSRLSRESNISFKSLSVQPSFTTRSLKSVNSSLSAFPRSKRPIASILKSTPIPLPKSKKHLLFSSP